LAYYFPPFIPADYHKLDTPVWRVASHLHCTKRINIKLGVPVGNAVDPSLSLLSITPLVGTEVENSATWYFIRKKFQGTKRKTGMNVAQNTIATW
jgi:hypothetical protein